MRGAGRRACSRSSARRTTPSRALVAGETEKTQTWLDEVEHSMNADSKFVQLHDNVGAIPSSKMF